MLQMRKITAATAIAGALAVPAAAAADPVPDAADGYRGLGTTTVDKRSPDSQLGRPSDTPLTPQVRVIEAPGNGFDWGDAGIGAAGGLAVVAIAGGAVVLGTGRRRSARRVVSAG
jgi:hypothetical protein